MIRNPFQVADAHRLFRDRSRNKETSVGVSCIHTYFIAQPIKKIHNFKKSVRIYLGYIEINSMNPLLQLTQLSQIRCSQRTCLETCDIDLIKQTVSYLNQLQSIDWMDGDFHDLPRILKALTRTNAFQDTAPAVIAALEPLFALLPQGLNQTKGLPQNDSYTEFVHRVLEFSSDQAIDLLHKGMSQGRHLYVEGENLSLAHQRSIVRYFGTKILTQHTDQFDKFLRGFDEYHDRAVAEKFYQEMLYEAVSNAHVNVFDTLLPYMSLTQPRTKSLPLITREELFSMQWMEKSTNMNCELYTSVPPRDMCSKDSFDERIWQLVDWIECTLTPDNAQNVALGVGTLAEHLCCMNEENVKEIEEIRTQDHPIFSRIWTNPLLSGHRTHVVSRLLQLTDSLNLPGDPGCETAWMLYEKLPEDEQMVPQQYMSVLQQYPPYAKLQLSATVADVASIRSVRKI